MSANENLIKIFEYALQQEETGKAFFQNSLQRMGMGAAISAFKRLIQEEEGHILFIKNILEGLKKGSAIELPLRKESVLEPSNYFNERAKSEFLQQCLEGSMVPEVTIFNTAWLIEKDLSEFYEKMSKQTEGKSKEPYKCSQPGRNNTKNSSGSFAINSLRPILKCPGAVNL